jgi:flagellin
LIISTNTAAQMALGAMSKISTQQEESSQKLSSGDRIYTAAVDPAGLAISENLKARVRSLHQAKRNATEGISIFQVAESTVGVIGDISIRLRELAMQAATDTVSSNEREAINKEFSQLTNEVQRLSNSTTYNGRHLINGSDSSYGIQVGVLNNEGEDRISYNTSMVDLTKNALGLARQNVLTKEGAQRAIVQSDQVIHKTSQARATLGSILGRLQSATQNIMHESENSSAAKSRIRDADFAVETANNLSLKIRSEAATGGLKMSRQRSENAVRLLDSIS